MPPDDETRVAPAEEPVPTRWQRLGGWSRGLLTHPLVVTGFAAVLGAIFIPQITNQWQDRQKENDLKQGLLEQISTSSTTAVRQAASLVNGSIPAAGGEVGEAKSDVYAELRNSWLIDRAAARSRIVVYFPGLYGCWYSYERAVADFLSLGSGTPSNDRVDTLEAYVDSSFARDYTAHLGTTGTTTTATTTAPASTATSAATTTTGSDTGAVGSDDHCKPLTTLPDVVQQRFLVLRDHAIRWDALRTEGVEAAAKAPVAFRDTYQALAEELLIGMERIVYSIEKTPAEGFDHGPW